MNGNMGGGRVTSYIWTTKLELISVYVLLAKAAEISVDGKSQPHYFVIKRMKLVFRNRYKFK